MTNEELVKLIQEGKDVQVNLGILYEQNKNFIYFVARPYLQYAEADDLLQEGYIGFQEAVFHYSADSGAKFSTYAQYRIKAHCKRYVESFSSIRRIPSYLQNRIYAYKTFIQQYKTQHAKEPDYKTIMKELKLSERQLNYIRKILQESQTVSLQELLPGDGESRTLEEVLPADGVELEEEITDRFFQEYEKKILDEAIKQLEDNERTVITCKYWDSLTASAISEKLNLPLDKIKQLEEKAFQVLKRNSKIRELLEERFGYDCSMAYKISRKFALDYHTSTTEMIALERVSLEQEQKKLVESVDQFFDDLLAEVNQ